MITRGHEARHPEWRRRGVPGACRGGVPAVRHISPGEVAAVFTNSSSGSSAAPCCSPSRAREPSRATTAAAGHFVWVGQGLIGVVLLWAPTELADRIRTGDVIADLLRPVDPVWQLARRRPRPGRARRAHPLRRPRRGRGARLRSVRAAAPRDLCAVRVLDAAGHVVCFGCRYLVNAAAYWLLDARGPQLAWTLLSGVLGGLYFPLWFLPRAVAVLLIVAPRSRR